MPRPLIPKQPRLAHVRQPRRRGSPRIRGYDAKWDRFSAAYREENPFCAWCEQEGRQRFATLVDHKFPVADGGAIYDRANFWALCRACHGRKYEMEDFARKTDQMVKIVVWCDAPEDRPAHFRAL